MRQSTILFGNGINRISKGSISWGDMLERIKGTNRFAHKTLPNTMIYENIVMNEINGDGSDVEFSIKSRIATELQNQPGNEVYDELVKLNFTNYITTNYDYAFEKSINLPPALLSTENIYSLRRKRTYENRGRLTTLWHAHGEINQPKTIMLGLDHYCGSITKLNSYIKGGYENRGQPINPMRDKLKDPEKFCYTSWVDLFFCSDIHIVGLSFDYSEIDLWWILNKRARMIQEFKITNKIYFYTNEEDLEKHSLLHVVGVTVILVKT